MPRTARVVAFSTTPEMAEQIDRLAAEQGRSRSELLRVAVAAYAASASGQPAADQRTAQLAAEPPATYSASAIHAPASLPGLAHVLSRRREIAEACADAGVSRLWAFGSAVRDDFVPGASDFDFAVEWAPGSDAGVWGGKLAALSESLAVVLGGRVDLGEMSAVRNPYVRAAVGAEKVLVYERA